MIKKKQQKNKKNPAPHNIVYLRCHVYKDTKGWFTRHQICWQDSLSKLVEHKKFGLIIYFGLPFSQRNATYKLERLNWLPPRIIVSYNRPL